MTAPSECSLQVLISAYGPEALSRIASLPHPAYTGVEYLVGWQNSADAAVPQALQERDDFRILRLDSKGLCRSRNALLSEASAPWVLISDDDIEYTSDSFRIILEATRRNSDCGILTFRFDSTVCSRQYPDIPFSLANPPKGYFATSFEILLNRALILAIDPGLLRFHEAFGINGNFFGSGEEELLLHRLLRHGIKGEFMPATICRHDAPTTAEKIRNSREETEAKGAAMLYLQPSTWPLRMLCHAARAMRDSENRVNPVSYCRHWLAGVKKARTHKLFKDY